MGLFDLFKNNTPTLEEGLEQMKTVKNAVLLDVRSEQEYKEGHVPGSVNFPINKLPTFNAPKETPIFVYCLSGARANRACAFLQQQGYYAVNIGGIAGYRGTLE